MEKVLGKYVKFEVGTKSKWACDGTIEVVKKTRHFTTFRIVAGNVLGEDWDFTFRRKEQIMLKDNGWLSPSTFTMGVNWRGVEIYACDFN